MQHLAASYLEHFEIDFSQGVDVRLAEDAPADLVEIVSQILDVYGPKSLVCVYEALNVAADSDLPHMAEVDEKVCPLDLYYILMDYLSARSS